MSSCPLPNLVQIGGFKCGSTTVASVLDQHPEICISDLKEPQFFTYNYKMGLDWYRQTFTKYAGEKIVGDASTSYSHFLNPPRNWGDPVPRMREVLGPDVKILYVIRHPVKRLLSAYHYFLLRSMTEAGSVEEFLAKEPEHLETGHYLQHIEKYLEAFDRQQLKVVAIEKINEDPARAYASMLEFLGLDPAFEFASFSAQNTSESRRQMPFWMTRMSRYMRRRPVLLKAFQLVRRPTEGIVHRFGRRVPRPEVSDAEFDRIYEIYRPGIEALSEWMGEDLTALWAPRG